MEFLCPGFCSSNMGLFTAPVTDARHIDRLIHSGWPGIRYAVQVLVALCFGTLVNRFGIKKMVFAGLYVLIGAALLRAVGTKVLDFYIAGVLHGAGIVFVGGTMAGTIAARIISLIINSGETFGCRKAYLLSAVVTLAVSVVILVFLRDNPGDGAIIDGKQ